MKLGSKTLTEFISNAAMFLALANLLYHGVRAVFLSPNVSDAKITRFFTIASFWVLIVILLKLS
jgi:hypothetical protein